MWPWLMILAGTLIIIGALVARARMMRDYRARLEDTEPVVPAPVRPAPVAPPAWSAFVESPPVEPTADEPTADEPPLSQPTFEPQVEAPLTRRAARAGLTPARTTTPKPPPLFADRPVGHRLSSPPTIRVRAQDVPLQDWLRYYAEGNAWSGVIQSISDRITGDRELQPYFGSMDRQTLQRHVMSTVMMLTGEGVTVGAVRRLAEAHLQFVQAGGDPITEATWDRLAATLGNALREHGVPEFAVQGLEHTAAPLRSVIVARDRP